MTIVIGNQVQAGEGSWTGSPTSYTYQWQQSANGSTSWTNISGETRSDYIIVIAQSGKYLRCAVTATNAAGSGSVAYSTPIGPVIGPTIPENSVAPVATGTTTVGLNVLCTSGDWLYNPTSFAYQWQTSTNGTTGWTNLVDATNSVYTLQSTENGLYVRCAVVGSNAAGASSPANSNALGPVITVATHFLVEFDAPNPTFPTFDLPEPIIQ